MMFFVLWIEPGNIIARKQRKTSQVLHSGVHPNNLALELLTNNDNVLGSIKRGALGYIRNRKPKEKNHPKPQNRKKNSAKTDNRIQNRQKPIQWWQVGYTEQTKLTLISPKYLWMSWTLSEAFVSFCVCLNHRLCFWRSLEPRLCGSISEKPLVMEPS